MSDREGGESDPNTESGFNAALAKSVGSELSSEQIEEMSGSDTDVLSGLTTEESRPRDEHGRFLPKPEAEPVEEAGAAPAEAEQQEPDPVQEVIEQHGGDAAAALVAALKERDEAQSLIGRQGNEVGDLRQQLAELKGRFEQAQEHVPAVSPVPFLDAATSEGIENMVAEQGGHATMSWVVENRPDLIDAVVNSWKVEDPVGAAEFVARKAAYETMSQFQPQAVTPDPILEDLRTEKAIAVALDSAKEGLTEGEWTAIKPFLPDELSKAPQIIQGAIMSPDKDTRQQGINALVQLTKGRAIAEATAQAKAEQVAASVAGKQAAQVATGSLRPVTKGETGEPKTSEEISAAFRDALLATETTSVRDGLTYAK